MNSFLYLLEIPLLTSTSFTKQDMMRNMIWHAAMTGIYIDNIGVDEKFRGVGIGTALIEYALGVAEFDYSVKYVGLGATSREAKEFFQKKGFIDCPQGLPAEVFGDIAGVQFSTNYTGEDMGYMLQVI